MTADDRLMWVVLVCAALMLGWHLHELWLQLRGKLAVWEATYYVMTEGEG